MSQGIANKRSHLSMDMALKVSSEGRFWTGFNAALYDTFGGVKEVTPSLHHHVSMHVGPPVRAACRCDGGTYHRLQKLGDINVVPLGCTVRWEDDGPTSILSISLTPSLVNAAATGMGLNPDVVSIAPQIQLNDTHLQHICWALVAELEDGVLHDRLYADSLGMALAAHLLRRYSRKIPPKVKRALSKGQFERVTDYIQSNLDLNLSLRDLAEVAGVSASYFKSLFKESVGVPVHQYVVQKRVDSAVRLLLRGDNSISEIALQAGFADQSHMARCMRRILGTTPGEVIRQRK